MVFHTYTILVTFLALLPSFTYGHFRCSFPVPRAPRIKNNEIGCENTNTNIPPQNVFPAGSWMVPRHGKTNHNGGFDLYSLVKLQPSPSLSDMLDDANVFHMECQTLNCATKDFNQGGKFVGDELSKNNSCWGSGFYWPNTPGDFTMFWYNYGSFGSNGVAYQQLPVYSNCANIRLTQSNAINSTVPKCTFGGGDDTYLEYIDKRPSNQECGYKRFTTPLTEASPVKRAIEDDQKLGDKDPALHRGVAIGVPDIVRRGKCAIIENPIRITDGPTSEVKGNNNNKIPPPPPGGYTYKQFQP